MSGAPSSRIPSRRSFLRLSGLAATLPLLSEGHLAWAALQSSTPAAQHTSGTAAVSSAGPVMINANENPLGPCPEALTAITTSARTGGRYDASGEIDRLTALYAQHVGLPADHVLVYAGSSEPLHYSVLAFTSPTAPYVTADPSYEAGMWAAKASGAPVIKVPLTPAYAHDVRAMVAASSSAGLLYICNPNNPTGTTTAREDILWAEQHKPKGSILLVDEAYIHFSDMPSALDLVAQGKDVIVLRTFSKIYGMAGIRCGVAMGRPDLLAKLQRYGMNPMPVTAAAAATASLANANLIDTRRQINANARATTITWLKVNGWQCTPSVSNCLMIDTGHPGKQVIEAMRLREVYIGRTWPAWPNHVRVSVGTPEEMARFQTAFAATMTSLGTPIKA
ncbi:MAG: pyridoxal phosphate-dependent aminotransferase [Janthinobacterium lividum]